MRYTLPLIGVAAIAAAAIAIPQISVAQPGVADPAKVVSGEYLVDADHSQVTFSVNHLGFSEYSGQFVQPTGSLSLDAANPAASRVEVVFPIDKVLTTSPHLDTHLKTPEFFDTAKYPEGRFTSTRVTVNGSSAAIAGNLTLKGVTRPVVLNARFVGAGINPMSKKETVGFKATASINRSDFGIDYGLPVISDRVDLVINAAFEAPGQK